MNYLAHILLSGPDPDWQLGGFLGDFVKGPLPTQLQDDLGQLWRPGVLQGVRLHRRLDAWIDRQPAYLASLELLGPRYRRLGGVALDVFFDHLLVRHWSSFCDTPLAEFNHHFYRLCQQQQTRLPARASRFVQYAARYDLFNGYGETDIYRQVLAGIDQRIRFDTNLVAAGEQTLQHYDALQGHFLQLMPATLRRAEQWRAEVSSF